MVQNCIRGIVCVYAADCFFIKAAVYNLKQVKDGQSYCVGVGKIDLAFKRSLKQEYDNA